MNTRLYSAAQTVILPDEAKPLDCWLYAIIYRQNKEAEGMWLPEGLVVGNDPSDALAASMAAGRRNPLNIQFCDGRLVDHPDRYGEYFRLTDGSVAQVFNRGRDKS